MGSSYQHHLARAGLLQAAAPGDLLIEGAPDFCRGVRHIEAPLPLAVAGEHVPFVPQQLPGHITVTQQGTIRQAVACAASAQSISLIMSHQLCKLQVTQ